MHESKCDKCGGPLSSVPVIVCYTLPGFHIRYDYCSEKCKWEHKLQLIRETGL